MIRWSNMNLYDIYHSKIDRLMTLYILMLDQLSLSLSRSMSLNLIYIYIYVMIDWREKKKKRDEASMKRIITSFGDFLYLSFSVSSRIQIICVWMTRVLHHLSDINMRHVAPVSRSRMNGQLDVTGARRHTHLYIWWMMESKMTV